MTVEPKEMSAGDLLSRLSYESQWRKPCLQAFCMIPLVLPVYGNHGWLLQCQPPNFCPTMFTYGPNAKDDLWMISPIQLFDSEFRSLQLRRNESRWSTLGTIGLVSADSSIFRIHTHIFSSVRFHLTGCRQESPPRIWSRELSQCWPWMLPSQVAILLQSFQY